MDQTPADGGQLPAHASPLFSGSPRRAEAQGTPAAKPGAASAEQQQHADADLRAQAASALIAHQPQTQH